MSPRGQESEQGLDDFLNWLNHVANQTRDDVLVVQLCSALREALERRLKEEDTPQVEENPQTAEELFMQCTGRTWTNDLDDRVLLVYAEAKIRDEKSLSPAAVALRLGIDVGSIYREGWGIRQEIAGLARESGKYYLASARGGGYFLKKAGNRRRT